jgi:DNA-binding transcriptional MocR family regulator
VVWVEVTESVQFRIWELNLCPKKVSEPRSWIVCTLTPGRFREAVVDRKFATTLGTSVPPQAALALYLQEHSYDRHLRTLRRSRAERVRQMQDVVEKYFPSSTRLSRPQGGCVLWVQLPVRIPRVTGQRFHEDLDSDSMRIWTASRPCDFGPVNRCQIVE